jgi:hypothetical protein
MDNKPAVPPRPAVPGSKPKIARIGRPVFAMIPPAAIKPVTRAPPAPVEDYPKIVDLENSASTSAFESRTSAAFKIVQEQSQNKDVDSEIRMEAAKQRAVMVQIQQLNTPTFAPPPISTPALTTPIKGLAVPSVPPQLLKRKPKPPVEALGDTAEFESDSFNSTFPQGSVNSEHLQVDPSSQTIKSEDKIETVAASTAPEQKSAFPNFFSTSFFNIPFLSNAFASPTAASTDDASSTSAVEQEAKGKNVVDWILERLKTKAIPLNTVVVEENASKAPEELTRESALFQTVEKKSIRQTALKGKQSSSRNFDSLAPPPSSTNAMFGPPPSAVNAVGNVLKLEPIIPMGMDMKTSLDHEPTEEESSTLSATLKPTVPKKKPLLTSKSAGVGEKPTAGQKPMIGQKPVVPAEKPAPGPKPGPKPKVPAKLEELNAAPEPVIEKAVEAVESKDETKAFTSEIPREIDLYILKMFKIATAVSPEETPELIMMNDSTLSDFGTMAYYRFMDALSYFNNIGSVILRNCDIEDDFAQAFYEYMSDKRFPVLEVLDLLGNRLTIDGMVTIIAALDVGYGEKPNDGEEDGYQCAIVDLNLKEQLAPLVDEETEQFESYVAEVFQRNSSILRFSYPFSNRKLEDLVNKSLIRNAAFIRIALEEERNSIVEDHIKSSSKDHLPIIDSPLIQSLKNAISFGIMTMNESDSVVEFIDEPDFRETFNPELFYEYASRLGSSMNFVTIRLIGLELTDAFLLEFVKGVKSLPTANPSLETLTLDYNQLSGVSLVPLLEAFQSSSNLLNFSAIGQEIPRPLTQEQEEQLVLIAEQNQSLVDFKLDFSNPANARQIIKFTKRNKMAMKGK